MPKAEPFFHKSCDVKMFDVATGAVAFVVQVYGRSAAEFTEDDMTRVIERHPNIYSHMLALVDRPVRWYGGDR